MAGRARLIGVRRCTVLVDYDNFFPNDLARPEQIQADVRRMIELALCASPSADWIDIRLYGGWLMDGVLTNRASELQSAVATAVFPFPHPHRAGLLRGSISLATRLAAVPDLVWEHTFRARKGLPRLRLATRPRPDGCVSSDTCPVDLLHRMSRRKQRTCHARGCQVSNRDAFIVQEQKMVDSLLCCDILAIAATGSHLLVLSDDLDVLPAVAMASATTHAPVVLVRSSGTVERLYDTKLTDVGVEAAVWEAA